MSTLIDLRCTVCNQPHDPGLIQSVCSACGKVLSARYDYAGLQDRFLKEGLDARSPGMWRYAPVLPVIDPENVVSLGELMTPLVKLERIGSQLGLESLWLKDEGMLPTGSFKSRGLAMAVSKAKEQGIRTICLPSAGNAAGAAAAYAARAGIRCHVFMPVDTPSINIKECHAYGAEVELVAGTISDAGKRMKERRETHPDWFDVSTLKEPYRLEGKKTMGYEIAEQFHWELPDVILYPTGGGTGLVGMWKAFKEMELMGWIGPKRPRMISVQSDGCAPIVRAFERSERTAEFWQGAETCASGLRVPGPFADYMILDAVYSSSGAAVAVKDADIRSCMAELARTEGILACPEGAATLLALRELVQSKRIAPADRVVLFNTASGLKYAELLD